MKNCPPAILQVGILIANLPEVWLCVTMNLKFLQSEGKGGQAVQNKELGEILAKNQIFSYGVCDYQGISEFLPCRNRERIPENAQSVIVCAFPYYTGEHPGANVCKYAMVPDYHYVVRQILNQAAQELEAYFGGAFVGFSDVSAIPERECALASGLGFPGVNGLVIHPAYGTFFVIGELVTDCRFIFDSPLTQTCMECGACVNACPAGAISRQGVDYTHCLSEITQKKGELTLQEQELVRGNGLMWGCDCCQNCCPHNRNLPITYLEAFASDVEPVVTRENLNALCKTRAFGYKGKTLLKRNLELIGESEPK